MKTLRILSIIGLVLSFFGVMMIFACDPEIADDAYALLGWLFIVTVWLIAQSITTLVQAKK